MTLAADCGGGEGHTVEPFRRGGAGSGRGGEGRPLGQTAACRGWRAEMGASTVGAVALLALFFDLADGAYGVRPASVQSPVSAFGHREQGMARRK